MSRHYGRYSRRVPPLVLLVLLTWTASRALAQTSPAPTFTNSLGMEFVLIPAGTFLMGSEKGEADEKPVHQVTTSRPFYLGKYEVTQAQWQAVMGNNPSRFPGNPQRPIEQVSWEDAQAFMRALNAREGGTLYRLPTEAEWEYAVRAGSKTVYSFGDDPGQLKDYGWYQDNANRQTHPVGQLRPNAWGLYDMHGNVWEWIQDWYGPYTSGPVKDPKGPDSGTHRARRGGGWNNAASYCRATNRYSVVGFRDDFMGIRVAREERR